MSTRPRLARLATDELARERVDVSDSPPDRAAEIAAIGDAIVRAHARRVWRKWAFAVTTAAAAAVLVLLATAVARRPLALDIAQAPRASSFARAHGAGALARDGRERRLHEGEEVLAGDRVVARGGDVSVTLSTGTEIEVEDGGDVELVEATALQLFSLRAGVLRAHVAKLLPGQRFLVRTPDAEIEVRGTVFTLRWAAESSCGSRTRLVVTEGMVAVRAHGAEDLVPAGRTWPACERAPAADAAESQRERAIPTAVSPPSSASPGSAELPARGAAAARTARTNNDIGSTALAAENAIFAEAVAARRQGDLRAAIAAYERLLSLHAASPLAEDASAERMRLLVGLDDARAREAAAAYLARYPNGFAHDEAREILAKRR
jgi:hypothetical protein